MCCVRWSVYRFALRCAALRHLRQLGDMEDVSVDDVTATVAGVEEFCARALRARTAAAIHTCDAPQFCRVVNRACVFAVCGESESESTSESVWVFAGRFVVVRLGSCRRS